MERSEIMENPVDMELMNKRFVDQFEEVCKIDTPFAEYYVAGMEYDTYIFYRASMKAHSYFIPDTVYDLGSAVYNKVSQVETELENFDVLFSGIPWTLIKVEGGWTLWASFRCFDSYGCKWDTLSVDDLENNVVDKEENTSDLSEEAIIKALESIDQCVVTSESSDGIPSFGIFKSLTDDINWYLEDEETVGRLKIPKKLLEG